MTALEQWKQLAARENAAMRSIVGDTRAFVPHNIGKPKGGGMPLAQRQLALCRAIERNPGQPRHVYLEMTGLTFRQWKGTIGTLVVDGRVVSKRMKDGRYSYHLTGIGEVEFTKVERDWILPPRATAPIPAIIRATAEEFGVSEKDLRSGVRLAHIAQARQAAYLVASEITDASLPRIGREFGRDHTTILHGIEATKKRMTPELRHRLDRIAIYARGL